MAEKLRQSLISNKYPTNRDIPLRNVHSWLNGKRVDDNAEGLWRIHDTLYDLTDFIEHHPGGSDWLKLTKGTDITELFESHHISKIPEQMIGKFEVRHAEKPRNITLTLKEGGFYRTLKERVREKLKTVDSEKYSIKSDRIHSTLLIVSYFMCIVSGSFHSYILAIISGLLVTWTTVVSHNYFHRRDNWRMYAFNLSLMSFREWRVSHAMSHHMYTNSYHDLEQSLFEPFLCWIPNSQLKTFIQRYLSWLYSPLIYTILSIIQYVGRLAISIITGVNMFNWDDLIAFTIPLAMYLTTNVPIMNIFEIWFVMLLSAGFTFGWIGLNAAHHHPEIIHDGDAIRNNRDWGLYQMDTTIDRSDLKGSQFLVLTHFGDHILHHLFPTLDHGVLPDLYPILFETIADFEGEVRECSWIHHIIGQFKQLARITPNPLAPGKSKTEMKGNRQTYISTH